tara:strand:- start:429 stop:1448 length:1020 start_codon:yes stop_codon:yes gene_type:complete
MGQVTIKNAFPGDAKQREDRKNADPASKANTSGVGFGIKDEERPRFDKMPCEIVLPTDDGCPNGAYIVFGRDRVGGSHPDSASEGPKQWGDVADATGTAMIDLVVGRHACLAEPGTPLRSDVEVTDDEGNVKMVPNKVNPSFVNDAARIYISQKSAIDEAFGLTPGGVGNPDGKSCVALKADGIRLVAREGIKIIADIDKNNSAAFKNTAKGGINLIYGNTTDGADYELHPMVKGNHLKAGLEGLADLVGKLASFITDIQKMLMQFFTAYMAHQHLGNLGQPAPLHPVSLPGCIQHIITTAEEFGAKCMPFMAAHAQWKTKYIFPASGKYILSSWNYAN